MIYWIGILSVSIAAELVLAGSCLSMFFPPHQAAAVHDLFTTYQQGITPKRDVFFLRLFIVAGIAAFVLLMRFFAKASSTRLLSLKYITGLQAATVVLETFFLFKYAVFRYPIWLNGFYASFIVSILLKVFSPEVLKFFKAADERLKAKAVLPNLSLWLTLGGMVLVPLIIWVPDVEGAVARMFFGEQFHHIDGILISPAWVHLSGNILGVDNTARYAIGGPVIVAEIAQHLLGGFNYVTAVTVVMAMSVVYYWIWFYVLRLVLKDTAWAFIALFLGIRLQFFNIETFPFIFTYPQVTPFRFFCDSLFFLLISLHAFSGRLRWLYLASALSGFAVFYVTGEGVYVLASFYVFLLLRELFVISHPGQLMKRLSRREMVIVLAMPWAVLFVCLWSIVGRHIFTSLFWRNQFDYVELYETGVQAFPMLNNLTPPYVDRAATAFIMPVLYLWALVIQVGRLMQKSLKTQGLLMAAACVFLLISYNYHATVANNMPAYLRNGVVIAMLAVYGFKQLTAGWKLHDQRLAKLVCGLLVFVCLVTTHQFLLHPNIFNLSRNPMTHPVVSQVPPGRSSYLSHLYSGYPEAFKLSVNGLGQKDEMLVSENDFADDDQLKSLWRKESDYSQDAALIDALTAPDQKVPLVSSFENLILMQAKRRPFFYLYFMIDSQPRRMRKFPVTFLFTKRNLQREIDRIEREGPPYIFVEKTYFVSPIPRSFLYDNEDLVGLLSYIFSHYAPYKQGEFLVALKRK